MQDFIERLRAKPEHVRKQIAIGTSSAITGVVAAGWIVSLVANHTFALDTTPPDTAIATDAQSGFQQLMGAAGAFAGATTSPELKVLETNTRSTLDRNEQEVDTRTVIPF